LIVGYNDIKKYWAEGAFLGHSTLSEMMSQTRFQETCGSISLMSCSRYDGDTANDDHHWSSRSVLDQFIQKSTMVAVPVDVSALDENSSATKKKTKDYFKCAECRRETHQVHHTTLSCKELGFLNMIKTKNLKPKDMNCINKLVPNSKSRPKECSSQNNGKVG
jgi:hypothetical protein